MTYIDYNINRSDLDKSGYQNIIEGRLQILQNKSNLKKREKAEKIALEINGHKYKLNADNLARQAMSRITSISNNTAEQTIENLYSTIFSAGKELSDTLEQYKKAVGDFIAIKNGLIPDGTPIDISEDTYKYQIKPDMERSVFLEEGNLSNQIGNIGEATSILAQRALLSVVYDEIIQRLKSITGLQFKAEFTNKGDTYSNGKRSQTDNNLTLLISNDGQNWKTAISINLSDKANLKLRRLSHNKSTNSLTFRNSTVSKMAETLSLDKKVYYNVISYHRDKQNQQYSGMATKAGLSLLNLFGYQLLSDMFSDSDDKIHFTVYGTKIIPERNILNKFLEQNKNGKNRYQAQIRYWRLLDTDFSKIKGKDAQIEYAQSIIDKMPVQIKESIKFNYL